MKVWVEEIDNGKFVVKSKRLLGFTKTYCPRIQNGLVEYDEELTFIDHLTATREARKLATECNATFIPTKP